MTRILNRTLIVLALVVLAPTGSPAWAGLGEDPEPVGLATARERLVREAAVRIVSHLAARQEHTTGTAEAVVQLLALDVIDRSATSTVSRERFVAWVEACNADDDCTDAKAREACKDAGHGCPDAEPECDVEVDVIEGESCFAWCPGHEAAFVKVCALKDRRR